MDATQSFPKHALPTLGAITPWVGQTSNVWMYRQFEQLSDQLSTIVTWEYHNRDQFPIDPTKIQFVPEPFAEPLHGFPRTVDTFLGAKTGGERYGSKFEQWLANHFVAAGVEGVLAQFGQYAMVAEVACRRVGIPVFAHFHGHDMSARLRKKRYRQAFASRWHDFAGMIVVASYQRDFLLSQGFDPSSIALIPCGAPTQHIARVADEIRKHSNRDDSIVRYLFVGRFVEKKDPIAVLQAFRICHGSHPNARLRLVGMGPLEEKLHHWASIQNPELRDAIEFLGPLSPQGVIEEMASADVFVQHSRVAPDGDMEGWPVSIAEAMAAGLPIVATRHAGIVDQVIEGENGWLCDEGDWQQMSDDMARLAADANMRTTMGTRSRARAVAFDSDHQVLQLREFINDKLMSRSHRAAA
ncbi:glycosyltransferase family 4 protein [Stieleria varia]|uniref:GDP-mannose-dependent alpha-(1-6)-phosphatidylinositol monomannoside mannosyltransferase n=1 Tax=Stieleria varia TaxID=2528005 RepID=A0A5C6B5Q0_9BACT|nr:glycosyltransferase family 4 protein [Stieleria varia]TWU07615.1 GDP-mannose-dependent alpha-(1-6)-phosphatidylinositol monomannoside mannosyltransferase [Stieleria varia]